MSNQANNGAESASNFIREIIDRDLTEGKYDTVITRFPPEPNGYLHIGHAKSIVLNFGLAKDYNGRCHLRFDDTNPETENEEYIRSIKETVQWLGYDWGDHLYFASDYFEQLYAYAVKLIRDGKAYVDSQNEEKIRENRGSVNEPGKPSPYRDRSVDENLTLFKEMREGKYGNGEHVLRAKIDMASPHMIMRDPLLYRIKHAHHYRQGDNWCIYPMYDFAHPLEDAIENVTHSLCTLEFDTNRVLYDWVLENCLEPDELPTRPHQYEFARLNLSYTIMSKRKLLRLVKEGKVDGWDDPRLPTLAGMRRRGIPPEAIRTFCKEVGVTRTESIVEMSHFEHVLRDDLNLRTPRINGVTESLKVVITNYPEGKTDWIPASYWPRDIDKSGQREVPFTRELFIERDDFREDPPKGFHRLAPGREVRLRYGYFITCEEVIKNDDGVITELRCTYDPETRGGDAPDGRSPEGTLHWVSAEHAIPAELRRYNRLFNVAAPDAGDEDFTEHLNPESLVVKQGFVEPSILDDARDTRYQFERIGYFRQDQEDSEPGSLVLNEIVPLRDTWAEQEEAERQAEIERKRREKEAEKQRQRERSEAGAGDAFGDLNPDQRTEANALIAKYELDKVDAAVIARDEALTEFFRAVSGSDSAPPKLAANWIVNNLIGIMQDQTVRDLPFGPEEFSRFIALIDEGVISARIGDELLEKMMTSGEDPEMIVRREGLRQIGDSDSLKLVVEEIIAENPEKVQSYQEGKKALIGFFMGQVMQKTEGRANPEMARELLTRELEA
ncbi:MAG: glutamine--tRNA ligase/YqeY domain fusion protein [Candidatus Marinimicrobia bacterium]|nr:glutamine--tRNA ligase/YqeY domain fusion protein [Candidatus Neomarinimicrobiota bacterium]MCF7829991.1 glutamine--tRNA ligase/YqeY domain fusion protein [Candidatus Neomarinimicrobiota bacterium]MCF7881855.1 glutamine--tRNA ligase/YqeY domain fusion protein [Candidatus Neomarinimicrobiota bacterium]